MAKDKTEETRGIVMMAFGKPAYAKMAFNMALSIRFHSPDIKICIITDTPKVPIFADWQYQYFNEIRSIHMDDLYDNYGTKEQKMNPGKAKTRIYNYLPFDHNIYLDCDGALMKPIEGLFDECISQGGYYKTQVVGWHTIDKGNDFKEMQWAWADDMWEHFKLKPTDRMPAINSSFAYIRKGKEAEALFKQVVENFANPMEKLRMPWGATQPDELYTNVALAQLGTECDLGMHPVYFNIKLEKNWKHVNDHYYVLGIFGGLNFTHSSVLQYYDRLMHKYGASVGWQHQYKSHIVMADKHANKRAPML
jgi:hypothetical protein